MADQPQSFTTLFPWPDQAHVGEGLRRLMRVLDQLILPVINAEANYEQVVDQLRINLIQRFNEQVQPIFDQITEEASLGAIFTCNSSTQVTVGLGLKTFYIDEGSRRIFAASPYLAVVSLSDGRRAMTGVLAGFDRVNGQLIINALSCTGDDAVASDWYICVSPPPFVPQVIDAGVIGDGVDLEAQTFTYIREDQGTDGNGYV